MTPLDRVLDTMPSADNVGDIIMWLDLLDGLVEVITQGEYLAAESDEAQEDLRRFQTALRAYEADDFAYVPDTHPEPIYLDIEGCARCGTDHSQLRFRAFTNPVYVDPTMTYFAMCPFYAEPILMSFTKKEEG